MLKLELDEVACQTLFVRGPETILLHIYSLMNTEHSDI